MAFTGRLGTGASRLGNIVFGVSDGLGTGPLGFDAHVLSEDEVRVRYSVNVTESALEIGNYSLISTAVPGTAVTPVIVGARFYDERPRSVVLTVFPGMTTGTGYSLEVSGVEGESGDSLVNVAKNFTANVPAPPRALGAFQSKRGFVDIVFDKPVGLNSSGASFEIRDSSSPGPGVLMAQPPWAGEGIPEDTIRVSLPGGTPSASSFSIDFSGVTDTSLNQSSGTVPVTLALRSSSPYSLSDLLQFQITDAYVGGGDFEFLRFGVLRVFWNGPAGVNDAFPYTQFTLYQSGPHPVTDAVNAVTAPNAVLLSELITLCTDIKARFNDHIVWPGVHYVNDPSNAITSPVPSDLQECIDLLNEAQTRYLAHTANTAAHVYRDYGSEFGRITITPGNFDLARAIANNNLKAKYNKHLQPEQEVSFYIPWSGIMNYVANHATEPDLAYDVRSAYTYFTDLHIGLMSSKATVRIEANVPSQDTLSSTSSASFTGNFTARSYASPASVQSALQSTDGSVELRLTGDAVIPHPDALSLSSGSRPVDVGSASSWATLASIVSNINFLIVAFNWHRSLSSNAGHEQVDSYNSMTLGAGLPDVQLVAAVANDLKNKLNGHVRNEQAPFHLHADPRTVTAPDAYDMPSLLRLVEDIRDVYVRHNEEGPHYRPGYLIYNSGLHDAIRLEAGGLVDGITYRLSGTVRSLSRQIPAAGEIGTRYPFQSGFVTHYVGEGHLADVEVDLSFAGVAQASALASALPKSGLEFGDDGELRLESDQVEVYFSRPMARVPLDQTNLPVTGGGILQKESDWVNDRVASVRVVNMGAVSYTVAAVGLTDRAGNPVV